MAEHRWRIDSETGRLTDVLLCRPDNYRWIATNAIARATLERGGHLDHQRLQSQYAQLESAFDAAGVRRHYLKPEPHLPYQVYTRDSSQVTPWGSMVTQLFRPQRRGEYASVIRFYEESDGGPWGYSTAGTLEGGDIHIVRPGLVVVGHSGERTDEAGARQFAGLFEAQGWTAVLVPFAEHFLHFDVIFSMVADGLALACTDVMAPAVVERLESEGIRLLAVSYREAMDEMGCNVLALGGDRVISPRHSVRVNDMLRAEGIEVLDPELDLFAAGGGSVHCMTMPLARD